MSTTLDGRIALVTGAGRGLGREAALSLAQSGAQLALVARSADQLQHTADLIAERGGSAIAIAADISTAAGAESAKSAVEDRLGAPHVLVNAAGVFGPLETIAAGDPERWIDTLTINTIGPYRMCRALAAGMVTHGWGRIINYSSAASLHPPGPLVSAYATSKVALNQFTRHLATELAGSGVTANLIHPGDVKTAMWADIRDEAENLGPEGDNYRSWVKWVDETGGDPPAKAADLVLELAADKAAGTTGQFLWIADGLQAPIKSWAPTVDARPW